MKRLQTSLALIALFALMLPCTHAEEHHHHEQATAELCSMDHAECHSCSDEPCTESPEVARIISPVEVPAPQLQVFCELYVEHSFIPVVVPLPRLLDHLQTIRLLI